MAPNWIPLPDTSVISLPEMRSPVAPWYVPRPAAPRCSKVSPMTATVFTLDQTGNLFGTGITSGVDGLPVVVWHNQTGGVKAVHCSNVFCVPYARRR